MRKNQNNLEFKKQVKAAGVTICEVGFWAGLSETTVFRWLRYPLNEEQEKVLLSSLEKLKHGGQLVCMVNQ